VIPLDAVTGFADPHVRYGLRFRPVEPAQADQPAEESEGSADEPETPKETPQVVSLDAFRRRTPSKE